METFISMIDLLSSLESNQADKARWILSLVRKIERKEEKNAPCNPNMISDKFILLESNDMVRCRILQSPRHMHNREQQNL